MYMLATYISHLYLLLYLYAHLTVPKSSAQLTNILLHLTILFICHSALTLVLA